MSITELMSLKQLPNKPAMELLERFRKVRSRCNAELPKSECAITVVNNMHPQLRERLIA